MGHYSIPHLQTLERVLKPESAIVVRGTATGAKFDINLATGPNVTYAAGSDDIALHLSFRKDKKAFVANSYADGSWNGEEKLDAGGVQQGSLFEIVLAAAEDHFKVYINDNYVGDIRYRSPLDKITHVQIQGELTLSAVEQVGAEKGDESKEPEQPDVTPQPEPEPTPPQPKPEPEPTPPAPEPKPEPVPTPSGDTAPTPYVLPIPGNFGPGHKLKIVGIPESNAARFHINLYAGFLNAFHYEPRFSEKSVSRDSRKEGEDWDKQVETANKLQTFPYTPEKPFELVYSCEYDAFQVFVDGAHHFDFKHRLPPTQIDAVGIEGDVKLAKVIFE
jgi:galectin-4